MSVLQALLLGILQGLTEFIPVSSSAHLVLVPWLLGWTLPKETAFASHILLQLGTMVAALAYFWRDWRSMLREVWAGIARRRPFDTLEARRAWLLVLASVPAGVVGLGLKDFFENSFGEPAHVALELLGTSALLWVAELVGRRRRNLTDLNAVDALAMGAGQAIAIIPGISRSASTIAFGLGRNLDRPSAARFSFMMSVPVLGGAGLVALFDLVQTPGAMVEFVPLLIGFVASAVVGFACIHWLLGYLSRRPLMIFAYYCAAVSLLSLVVALRQQAASAAPPPLDLRVTSSTGSLIQRAASEYAFVTKSEFTLEQSSTALVEQSVIESDSRLGFSLGLPDGFSGWSAPVAWDGVAIFVSPANPLADLTLEQLQDIYLGRMSAWQALDAALPAGELQPVVREDGSDVRVAFDNLVLGGLTPTRQALIAPSTNAMLQAVAADPAAIGYAPLSQIDASVRVVAVSGVRPEPQLFAGGLYPLSVPVLALSGAEPSGAVRQFVLWLQSDAGQALVEASHGRLRS